MLDFSQMEKNTVDSAKQLQENEYVTFPKANGAGIRVMFVGNSITRHAPKPSIGWEHDCGMAASGKQRDYVHLLMRAIKRRCADPAFCICQVAAWERNYQNGAETFPLFEAARAFEADIIVMRCIENCPAADFNSTRFIQEYHNLIHYLNKKESAKLVLTTGFWHHPGDAALLTYGKENDLPVVTLGDLGEDDTMKATGLFSHRGVANHPGDNGMREIASRIFAAIDPYLK